MERLLKTPIYIPTAPSISNCANADVPMTILSVMSWLMQLLATCVVGCRYCILYMNKSLQKGCSTSLFRFLR